MSLSLKRAAGEAGGGGGSVGEASSPVAFLLAPQAAATGNAATADRLCLIIASYGFHPYSVDPASLRSTEDGAAVPAIEASGAVVVVALHGLKAARLAVGCKVPMVVVTGGTDVNVDIATDPEKAATMARVLRSAGTAAVVSFSQAMIDALHHLLSSCPFDAAASGQRPFGGPPPVHLIPQGVELPPALTAGARSRTAFWDRLCCACPLKTSRFRLPGTFSSVPAF